MTKVLTSIKIVDFLHKLVFYYFPYLEEYLPLIQTFFKNACLALLRHLEIKLREGRNGLEILRSF